MALQLHALGLAFGTGDRGSADQSHPTRRLGVGMTAPGNWRYVYASVPGVAHLSDGSECQDACAVRPLSGAGTDSLLLLSLIQI